MIEIGYDAAVQALRECVTERGENYVYTPCSIWGCVYWHDKTNEPGCLIGLALYKLGVSSSVLQKLGNLHVRDRDNTKAFAAAGFALTNSATAVFAHAQSLQDHSMPWGRAVAETITWFDTAHKGERE
jgi:hypothetical protein